MTLPPFPLRRCASRRKSRCAWHTNTMLAMVLLALPTAVLAQTSPLFADGFESEQLGGGASGNDFINDSGVGWCATASAINLPCPQPGWPQQDGERGRDALAATGSLPKIGGGRAGFDFTKVSSQGVMLPASATQWACVHDEVTGLTWELKHDGGGGARDYRNRFSWYDPNPATNGGHPGSPGGTSTCNNSLNGAACNTYEYVRHINAVGLCGENDWRMPSHRELLSIVDRSAYSPRVDTDYFKPFFVNSLQGPYSYWTATPAANGQGAWWVNFSNTGVSNATNASLNWIMLVRGGANQ